MNWKKTEVIENGRTYSAIAPEIISASRSTDIPACYSKEFIEDLRKGFTTWINPFNNQVQYISFENTRFVVFWTKNPEYLIPYLDEITDRGIDFYFQYTLNDYDMYWNEKTKPNFDFYNINQDVMKSIINLEPNIPSISKRINTFKKLSEKIGSAKIIWRFDPLLYIQYEDDSDTFSSIDSLVQRVRNIAEVLRGYTHKLVFSFLDQNYGRVKKNLSKFKMSFGDWSEKEMEFAAERISKIVKDNSMECSTCAEKIDFKKYDIKKNKCIDLDLILQLTRFPEDFSQFRKKEINTNTSFNFKNNEDQVKSDPFKDKGQREECGCCVSKDIGEYNTCKNGCVYCYATNV